MEVACLLLENAKSCFASDEEYTEVTPAQQTPGCVAGAAATDCLLRHKQCGSTVLYSMLACQQLGLTVLAAGYAAELLGGGHNDCCGARKS